MSFSVASALQVDRRAKQDCLKPGYATALAASRPISKCLAKSPPEAVKNLAKDVLTPDVVSAEKQLHLSELGAAEG